MPTFGIRSEQMSFFWFILGAALIVLIWGMKGWISKNRVNLNLISWIGIVITIILAYYTIAWSVSSIWEGEIQAAGMGLLFFGVPTLIIFGLTQKNISRNIRRKSKSKNICSNR